MHYHGSFHRQPIAEKCDYSYSKKAEQTQLLPVRQLELKNLSFP